MADQDGMKGKICMVTGATDGIGLITCNALAEQGAIVIVAGRNEEKAQGVINKIKDRALQCGPSIFDIFCSMFTILIPETWNLIRLAYDNRKRFSGNDSQ